MMLWKGRGQDIYLHATCFYYTGKYSVDGMEEIW